MQDHEVSVITNLPEVFPLEKLNEFDFGNVEAANDPLLAEPLGFCDIAAVRAALEPHKSVIVGRRGAGKSALFRLLRNGELHLRTVSPKEAITVGVQEPLDYKLLRSYVESKVATTLTDVELKYRVVWEVFLVHRCLAGLKANGGLSAELETVLKELGRAFEVQNTTFALADWIKSHALEVGAAFDTESVTPVPAPYLRLEPASDPAPTSERPFVFNLSHAKSLIQKHLEERGCHLVLLIDRLDEFVSSDDYRAQKLLLQGLLECERSYHQLSRIHLRLFVREDLFARLDFSSLGSDKVSERVVELSWSPSEIRQFVAQRITHNILHAMSLPNLRLAIDGESVVVDQQSARIGWPEIGGETTPSDGFWSMFRKKSPEEPNRVAFTDEINRQIILTLFPLQLQRIAMSSVPTSMDVFGFFERAVQESEDSVTPRTVLRFLSRCLDEIREHFRTNPNIVTIPIRDGMCHELIPSELVSAAYDRLKRDAWDDVIRSVDDKFSGWARLLATDGRRIRRHSELRALLRAADDYEVSRFLSFLEHYGVLYETGGRSFGDPTYRVANLYAPATEAPPRPAL